MLYYESVFKSIQGESKDAGLVCTFVRLYGCPIGCVYCDQPQTPECRKRVSVGNLVNEVKKQNCQYVCITGGEPLIYPETYSLVYELLSLGYKVSIETSGCIPIDKDPYNRSFRYVMDIKCPSSGVSEKNVYENLVNLQHKDEVKFVIKDRADYDFMKKVLKKYPTSASILVSPMFDINNKPLIGKELINWILEDKMNVRVQIQLHKIFGVL